ncbi:hemerythrin domain-containing protein [Proteiniborus sp. MB09-C3]|uniref:hemerythrin domain-containing protein n=1 Tax=Proteiniborus sp. MB09-C3 TaxID=3050072 RepID=UPI002552A753|nr:hemerythrin domain-containing protein [Proteiniborus sp. MB09-C3]WIV11584.1 hemerythrin domain-containing protein [Proteiniborus sp. MB09-C3]
MNTIEILVNEHDNIKKVLRIIRKICVDIVEGKEIPHDDLISIIDFIRNYADKYHHGKEEDMLFKDMATELVDKIGSGPVQGMLIEHDYGRSFVRELEAALKAYKEGNNEAKVDIISNAMGYANLLEKHIFKEDNMLYKYAEKNLKEETINKLDREFKEYEENKEHIETKEKYIRLARDLEKKYI